ncbi:MAG: biopolymer transporter ExbD [Bacteroidota bacterium]
MSKKPKRGVPKIDMTAMVDVAFLLLTFFILTTTRFREDSKAEVDTPSSVSSLEPPEKELMTITVTGDGKVFVGLSDIATRGEILNRFLSDQQKQDPDLAISAEGAAYFSTLQEFGVPVKDFGTWLSQGGDALKEFEHAGMSPRVTDSTSMTGNDLEKWVRWGRLADQRMRFAVKGDVNTDYPVIEDVISSLQEWDVNQFSLITSLEDGAEVVVEEEEE